ncbi:MAG: hypothetical protein ACRDNZ_14255 [Streptosporangiaceae bacterium]
MEDDDLVEQPDTARCEWCSAPLIGVRRGSAYCSRAHKNSARRARKRSREQVDTLRGRYPLADASLSEQYERAREARATRDVIEPDEIYVDEFGYTDGLLAEPADDPGDVAWSDAYKVQMAVQKIENHYRELARPYLDQLRRNPGVRPLGLVKLEADCADRIDTIMKSHQRAAALERAVRQAPVRQARAQERQNGIMAMAGFAADLPGGHRRYQRADAGRATEDVFGFPQQACVFGSDREMYQRSAVARELGQRVFSPDGWV